MPHITVAEAQAWLETTKLSLTSLDTQQEDQISSQVLAELFAAYPSEVEDWVDAVTTPKLVRSIIAMMYAGWFYDKQYSENSDENSYADRLRARARELLDGVINGSIDLPEVPGAPSIGQPVFYPTDASSAPDAYPTDADPSAGPPAFSMGKIF